MDVLDMIARLRDSAEFSAWSAAHPKGYLAHIFCMVEKEDQSWQIGFVDNGLVTVFEMEQKIKQLPADKPFTKTGETVPKLDESAIKIGLDAALGKAAEIQQEKYSADKPFKTIIILQSIDDQVVYNITYVTQSFKTLNIRVAAKDGSVISDNLVSFFEIDKK